MSALPVPTWRKLPRWRGFNLLSLFTKGHKETYIESDFQWIAEWGFDFVRLPTDYRCWIADGDWRKFDEESLKLVDGAIALGRKNGVHTCLNMHRAPGYCVNPPEEPKSVWTDPEAQEVCALHWANFARRYKGIPNANLSFDLWNEPSKVDNPTYAKVARIMVEAIRKEDPERLIIADGNNYGNAPVPELVPLEVAQSTRGYQPFRLSHFRAGWGGDREGKWPVPTWPFDDNGKKIGRAELRDQMIAPWKKLEALGPGVHVGEFGAFNKTPHGVVLGWLEDSLINWKEAGWGFAMWEFRGSFGIMDSGRADVAYEDFRGRKLDRALLELLRKY